MSASRVKPAGAGAEDTRQVEAASTGAESARQTADGASQAKPTGAGTDGASQTEPTGAGEETSTPILRARGLKHSFGPTRALQGLDLDVSAGEALAIMGPSGSGKSTLLHVLAGVFTPDAGSVQYQGREITKLDEEERAQLRLSDFGFVFQFGQLLPDLNAADNVSIPLLLAGERRKKALAVARQWLKELDVQDVADKLPTQMSGGQAQRVAIARALATSPRVLFTDEPTGSLDSLTAERTMEALIRVVRAQGTTLLIITHDPRTAAYADREVFVRDGNIATGRMAGSGRVAIGGRMAGVPTATGGRTATGGPTATGGLTATGGRAASGVRGI